jgi:hypothetical protein
MATVRKATYKGEGLWLNQRGNVAEVFDTDGMPFARLSTYVDGELPPVGFFFCKAYSENTELVEALIAQGALHLVGEPILLPPFGARVLIARIVELPQ